MRTLFVCLLLIPAFLGAQSPTIILPIQPLPAEERAARILQQYLQRMTGATVELVSGTIQADKPLVFIGDQPALRYFGIEKPPAIPDDGFFLHGKSNVFLIAGGGEMGPEYGVYTLLEILGCRKFTPRDSLIPSIAFLQLPEYPPTLEAPAFAYRELHYEPAFDPAWARWHKLKTKPEKEAEWGLFVHTFDELCPPERYFDSHPEFFSWNGARYSRGQICLSNDTVKQIVISALRQRIAEKPAARYWSVSQNDNYDYCKCPRCAASDKKYGSPAGTLLAFLNTVAAAFPDKTISTLAYQYTRRAPAGIQPAANVSICLCSIECDRGTPIAEGCPDFARDVREWSALTDKLMIWDYVVQFRSYVSPFPNWHTLQPNLQLFRDYDTRMLFEQGSGRSRSEFSDMRAYLLAKLMWNPDVSIDSILTDFGNGYYGKARGPVFDYVHQLSTDLEARGRKLWIYDIPQNEAFLDEKNLRRYAGILRLAEEQVKNDPLRAARVREAQLPVAFATLERYKNSPDTPWRPPFTDKEIPALLDAFVKGCAAAGIETLHEHGYKPAQYRTDYLAFVSKQVGVSRSIAADPVVKPAASPKYAGGNAAELTNQRVGETDYRFNWLGFEGADMNATVRLKKEGFSRVLVAFLQDQASWIFYPEKVVIECSSDGKTFEKIHEEDIRILPDGRKDTKAVFVNLDTPRKARFVRVRAVNLKKCPAWHPGNGNPCWIFADEIAVE